MTCDKVTFASYKGARKHAGVIAASKHGPIKLEPYKCPHCGAFHLTHRNTAKKLVHRDDDKYTVPVEEYVSLYEFTKSIIAKIKKGHKRPKHITTIVDEIATEKVFQSLFNMKK